MVKDKINKKLVCDVLIAGGGMAGMTLACGLAKFDFKVCVVDTAAQNTQLQQNFDGRSSAIAYAAYRMLDGLDLWPHMGFSAQPINEIRVSDGNTPFYLHFDHEDLGEGPLGYMVENRHTRQGLFEKAATLKNLKILTPDKINSYTTPDNISLVKLNSGMEIETKLVVGAEGRGSPLRKGASIGVTNFGYGQTGLVATIEHELPHKGIAHEIFLSDGPFAILPLTGNRASLVWTTTDSLAKTIMGLSPRAFNAEIMKRTGDFLGDVKAIDGRWSYPLTLQILDSYIDNRLVLIGDAAHGVHPVAGQGLNMGFRDIAALIEVLHSAREVGQDIGVKEVLEKYQRWRRTDNLVMAGVMDGLVRLFSNDIMPLKKVRDYGLHIVERIPSLKRFFMRHARGTVGKLPKLLKGEGL
ncbi:MAG: UbiH/UbiF/VisC/COQ6 family ubiquinone biosynthesis hydroxylase [Sphingomonadales bacterium]|jgi:2-octaprenyl-6-methoxyphenol hydroxylase